MNNKIIMYGTLLTIVVISTVSMSQVYAQDVSQTRPLMQRVMTRFNLNEEEVQEVIAQHRNEMQSERQQEIEEKLTNLVNDGKITEEQKNAFLVKHEEMQKNRDKNVGLTREERWAQNAEHTNEMHEWMEENGIELEQGFMRGERSHMQRGKRNFN